jgi:hypothetical protein
MPMRAKGRTQGRFVALSGLKKLASPPGSPYPLLIVDSSGLPVFFLCEWYRRKIEADPGRTANTYLDMALPWAGFLCWLLSIPVLKRALMLALPVLFLCYLLIR